MVKLSEQIEQQQTPTQRTTRTERVLVRQEQKREEREFSRAKKELGSASFEDYEQKYYSIDPKYRKRFLSPQELKQTPEYKTYIEKKKKAEAFEKWGEYFGAYYQQKRGKPFFLGLDPSNYELYMFSEVKKAMGGEPSSVPEFLVDAYRSGAPTEYSGAVKQYGMDIGEKIKITRTETETGEVIGYEEYYKDPETKQVLKGSLNKEEIDAIVREERLKVYQEKLSKRQGQLSLDLEKTDSPIMMGGTILDQERTTFKAIKPRSVEPKEEGKGISARVDDIFKATGELYFPSGFLGGQIKIGEFIGGLTKTIDEKSLGAFEQEISRTGVKAEAEEIFGQEYETEFLRSDYGKKAYLGDITIEEAQKKFEEGAKADIISQKYETYIKEQRAGKFTKEGFKIAGLNIAKSVVKLVPETTGGLVVTGAVGYAGYTALTFIPSNVLNFAYGGIGVIETTKAFSPVLSPEEKAGSLIQAGVTFGVLGAQGISYLRQPTIKAKQIKIKPSVDPRLQRGFVKNIDKKIVTDVMGKKTILQSYKANKFTEQLISGRRTTVSTKWRDLLGLDPIYKGIPYQQRGVTFAIEGLRGSYAFKTESAYQKALNLLTKRGGFSLSKARGILRYYQPKIILSDYSANILVRSGDLIKRPEITIKGIRDITQPVRTIDKSLGIKTRGATSIREIISGKGVILGEAGGKTFYSTSFLIEKGYLTATGGFYSRLGELGRSTRRIDQITAVADKGDEILNFQIDARGGLKISKDYPYSLFSEQTLSKGILPRGKAFYGEGESMVFKTKPPTTSIDLRQITGIEGKNIPRTTRTFSDLSKLDDPKYLKEIIKSFKNVYGKENLNKIIRKPNVKTGFDITGRGQIATGGGTRAIQELRTTSEVKTTFNPVKKIKNYIKSITQPTQDTSSIVKWGILGKGATRVEEDLNLGSAFKPNLKDKTILKDIILERQIEKSALSPSTTQTTIQKQSIDLSFNLPPILITGGQAPIPSIPSPRIPIIPIKLPNFEEKRRRKGKKVKRPYESGYLPDFTARAIGLKTKTITQKEAQKSLKKILTGLEIRRPVKVKF